MNKKLMTGLVLGMTMLASNCFAQVVEDTIVYKDNQIKVPCVMGGKLKVDKAMNACIDKEVVKYVKAFIDKHGKEGGTAWLTTEVIRDDFQYLTLRIASSTNFKGAAHPLTYVHGIVFDKQTGKRLPLSYFVEMPAPEQMEGYVRNNIFQVLGYDNRPLPLEGITPPKTISKEYLLDKEDNLDLIYQQYEIAPYAFGAPRIRLDKAYVDRNGHVLAKG